MLPCCYVADDISMRHDTIAIIDYAIIFRCRRLPRFAFLPCWRYYMPLRFDAAAFFMLLMLR